MTETVYAGYNNVLSFQIKEGDEVFSPAKMSAITKVGIVYLDALYHSTQFPNAFDADIRAAEGILNLRLGNLPLPVGRDKEVELILWANDYPDGIVWGTFDIRVVDLGV
jgi:hypothetical protein